MAKEEKASASAVKEDLSEIVEQQREKIIELQESLEATETLLLESEEKSKVAQHALAAAMQAKTPAFAPTQIGGAKLFGRVLDVVAVPLVDGWVPREKRIGGTTFPFELDEDGFAHYQLPESYARTLIAETAGLRHVFVGPSDVYSIKVDQAKGAYTEKVDVPRHSKRKNSNGKITFVPIVIESAKKAE